MACIEPLVRGVGGESGFLLEYMKKNKECLRNTKVKKGIIIVPPFFKYKTINFTNNFSRRLMRIVENDMYHIKKHKNFRSVHPKRIR
jgi:hypothetical protein